VFQQAQSIVCSLTVIIDAAERLIALMSQFNQSITKNEVVYRNSGLKIPGDYGDLLAFLSCIVSCVRISEQDV